ncbi:WxL domain-containing protein [Dellaglioa sp. P0083]|uniref:WxL domain-containing protein n=1 Tax=Dellaglioa kimchii TaxID=3344667 RepID=UPI0038D4077C
MKKGLTSALLATTILGAGLAVSSHVNAATLAEGASTDASVSFKAGDEGQVIPPVNPTDPTDPTDPGDGGNTGNSGNLAIVYATKTVDFGSDIEIPTKALTVKSAKDLAIEVGDVRGTNAGWALSVQADQFKSGSDELTGAVLSTGKGKVVVAEATAGTTTAVSNAVTDLTTAGVALNAVKNTGSGVTVDTLAAGDISLTVPAGVAKAEAYSTKMNWTLSDVPA